jgi:hypothetical protein
MEYLHFHKKLLPLVLNGLFCLSKWMVASRRSQYQVNMILDVASLKPHANDTPKSNIQLAGYALLLLLASLSSLIIAKHAGLDNITGQKVLFDITLMAQPACPIPNTADAARTPGSSETQSAQQDLTLPRNPPVPGNSSASQNHCSLQKPSTTATDDDANKPDDGDSKHNGDNSFDYTPVTPEGTPGEVLSPTVIICQHFFPLPSPHGWDIARDIPEPTAHCKPHHHGTTEPALACCMTKSCCLVVAKELNIKHDIFATTSFMNDIIAKSAVNSSRVLTILTTWHHAFFEQLTKCLDRQLECHMA